MFDIHTENDTFAKAPIGKQPFGNAVGNRFGSIINDQFSVVIGKVIFPIFNQLPISILLAFIRPPTFQVLIQAYSNDFIGGKKTIIDALLQTVRINGFAKISDVADFVRFFGCRSHPDVDGGIEIIKNLSPKRFIPRASAMAFIHHNQIKKIGLKLSERFLIFIPRELLIEAHVNLVGAIEGSLLDFGHNLFKG